MRLAAKSNVLCPNPKVLVEIRPLSKVRHLQRDALAHFLREWPKPEGRLDPQLWGHLADPAIPAKEDATPLTLIATIDGAYVGQGSIVARDLDHRLYRNLGPWMGGLCVLPEWRGNGIGKKLHFERLRIAADKGLPELFLFTEKREYPTVTMYEQFGWRVECELPDFDDGRTIERPWVMNVSPLELFEPAV